MPVWDVCVGVWGTHQAAPAISKQIVPFVAEVGGEDGEVGIRQLLEVKPAAGLRHQRVTEETERLN